MARAATLALLLAAAGFAPAPAYAAGCGQFFRTYAAPVRYYQPVYYQQAYVQPYVAPLYYRAGESIEREAIAELTAQKVVAKLEAKGLTSLAQRASAANTAVFDNCLKCHSADSSLNLADGVVTAENFTRWGQIAGLGIDVPKPMQALIADMKPEQKGAIADELLKLWAARPTNPPAPPDAGGLE